MSPGAVYLHECPASPAVPLYVLVSGVVALLVMSQVVMLKILPPELLGKIWLLWVVCLGLFAFAWFIYGESHSVESMIWTFDQTCGATHSAVVIMRTNEGGGDIYVYVCQTALPFIHCH